MEVLLNCKRCGKKTQDCQIFTCGHSLCSLCTSRNLFYNHLNKISHHDPIQIQCKCNCGTKEISLDDLYNVVLNSTMPVTCKKHSKPALIYCNKCENWFCEECNASHKDINPDHNTQHQQNEIRKCTKHERLYQELYCRECEEDICPMCYIEDKKHVGHNLLRLEDYAKQLRTEIEYQHYGDFHTHMSRIEMISNEFTRKLTDTLTSTLEKFNFLIAQVEESKAIYEKRMKETIERADIFLKIIKLLYTNFYSDLQKGKDTLNISLLKDITNLQQHFTGLDFADDTTTKLDHLQDCLKEINTYITISAIEAIQVNWSTIETWKSIFTMTGHSSYVLTLCELDDGRIISGSEDHTMKFWQVREIDFINTLTVSGHSESVYSIIQLRDGRIASGSGDHTIKIWEEIGDTITNTLTLSDGHSESVYCLIQMQDGRLASCSEDMKIVIWEADDEDFKQALTLKGHSDIVYSVIQLDDGRLASCSDDRSIKIWEVKEREYSDQFTLTGHLDFIHIIIQMRDGRIASGSGDKTIKIWEESDTNTGFVNSLTLTGHSHYIWSLLQLRDGRLASGSIDTTIKLWEVSKNEWRNSLTLSGHALNVSCLIQLKDGRLASSSPDLTIKIWD